MPERPAGMRTIVESRLVRFAAASVVGIFVSVLAATSTTAAPAVQHCNSLQNVAIKPSGEVLALGITHDCGLYDGQDDHEHVILVQLGSDGLIDKSFADNGAFVVPASFGTIPKGLKVAMNGSGVVIGTEKSLIGLDADGRLDPSFGTAGHTTLDFGLSPAPYDVAAGSFDQDSHGNYIVSGYYHEISGGPAQSLLARYTSDGRLEPAFGTMGRVSTTDPASGLRSGPGDSIFGFHYSDPGDDGIVVPTITKYGSDGSEDAAYGPNGDGTVTLASTGMEDGSSLGVEGFVVDPDGRVMVSGVFTTPSHSLHAVPDLRRVFARQISPSGVEGPASLSGVVTDLTQDGGRLGVDRTYEDPNAPFGPDYTPPIPNFGFYKVGADPRVATVANFTLGSGSAYASEARSGPNGEVVAGGTYSPSKCAGACRQSMVIAKLGSSPSGLDPAFGTNRGVTTFPQIDCSEWGKGHLGRCARTLPQYPATAKVLSGRTNRPRFIIKAVLPKSLSAGDIRKRIVSLRMPEGVKARGGVPGVRIMFGGVRLKRRSHSIVNRSIRIDLTAGDWGSSRRLRIVTHRGSIKPLSRQQLRRGLKFRLSTVYGFKDNSKETRTVGART